MPSTLQKNAHLMWRAGFGPAAEQLPQFETLQPTDLFRALQKASLKSPDNIDVADDYLKGLFIGAQEIGRMTKPGDLTETDKRKVRQKQREGIKNLNLAWLNTMVDSEAQLREKMAFFWHGHFASRNINVFFQQQLLQVIRENALGDFRTLLHEVSKSAAILNFLNAQQNRKGHPNENFAREVMELFTMGRGNYSETDVKEAARAFTGWSANIRGEFLFRKGQHDAGVKNVLGKSGAFGGEEVLDILLEQKATARFIAQKVYRAFVNEDVDKKRVDWLTDRFYTGGYNIGKLMEDIFTADWFYEAKNIGAKIKSPVELIAGIQRMLPMEVKNEESLLLLQRLLGQLLFYPPNVAGWPGGKTWIDSSTLMLRMRLPMMFNDEDALTLAPKTDDDQMGGRDDKMEPNAGDKNKGYAKVGQPINTSILWSYYTRHFESTPREELFAKIGTVLLQTPLRSNPETIKSFVDSSGRESFIKSATLKLMSTPEYQMC